jgi:hypothetical protein
MNKHVNKKHQKLVFELNYLYVDVDYHEAVFEDAKLEFHAHLKEELKKTWDPNKCKRPNLDTKVGEFKEPDLSADLDNGTSEALDPDVQALFRKITKLTHPDLCPPTDSEEVKQAKIEKFIKAKEAAIKNNWHALCKIALELGIELPAFNEKHLKWLETEITTLKDKAKYIESTAIWQWYHNEKLREQIMRAYLEQVTK